MSHLLDVLAFVLIPVVVTISGAVVAAVKAPSPRLSSYFQHFAAGVVFAAAAAEVLPDMMHRKKPLAVALGFAIGVAVMLGIRSLAHHGNDHEERTDGGPEDPEKKGHKEAEHGEEPHPAKAGEANPKRGVGGMIGAVAVDVLIDGLLIGIAFASKAHSGFLLTGALTLELLFVGLSLSVSLSRAGKSRGVSIGLVAAVAGLLLVGASIGTLLLTGLSDFAMTSVLAFAIAALLYLVTEELLVEAHEVPETPLTTATFFAGFLVIILVEMTT